MSDSTSDGLSPTRLLPPHFRCQSQVIGPRLPTTSDLATNWEVLTNPPLNSINLLELLTELRETLIYIYQFTKGCNNTDEQPDEEIYRARSGRVLSTGVLSPQS